MHSIKWHLRRRLNELTFFTQMTVNVLKPNFAHVEALELTEG